jgi:outer membrane lipoprotein-sorting protein
MLNRRFALLAALALAALAIPSRPVAAAADTDLYARMQRVNSGLQTFQADVTVAVETHGPPYISPTLQGKIYFKRPDRSAVIFQTLPFIAQQAKHVVAQMEPPSEWPQIYEVQPTGDDGNTATFKLVRKKNGRIDHVDVKVDDKTATVAGMTYYYKDNGGTIAFTQTYDQIDGNYVLKTQSGKVEIPHYNADVNSTFAHYKLNVPVDDSVFKDS